MSYTVYQNNGVEITIEKENQLESKVNVNGENLIWIEKEKEEAFKREFSALLDKYRI